MPEAIATTPLRDLFKFPFQGSNWSSRFLIGTALIFAGFLVPILPVLFVYGYVLQVMRQTIRGQDPTMPAWEDWGKLGIDGLRAMLVGFVYLLPGMIVFWGGMAIYFGSVFVIPLASASGNGGDEAVMMLLMFFAMAVLFLSIAVGWLLTFLGVIPLPAATAHLIAQDKLVAAFHVGEWWPLLRVNKLGYFISWVMVLGLSGLLYLSAILIYYTMVLCCLIPFIVAPIGFYLSLVTAALFGQTYRESVALLAARGKATQHS